MAQTTKVRAAVLTAALIAALPAAAGAQMRFGLRAGVNFSSVTGRDVDQNLVDTRPGLLAGGFIEAPLADIMGVELGVQYSQKGFRTPAFGSTATAALDYLEVPALLTVTVPGGPNYGFALYAGPTFSFAVHCKGEVFGFNSIGCSDAGVRSFDLGGDVGAGVRLALSGGSSLLVDGFYNFGFTSIDSASNPYDMKNQVFSLTAGIMFPVGNGQRAPRRPAGRGRGRG
jgi:hypothetical protein